MIDVEPLVAALREPQTLDHLVEHLASQFKYAWQSLHGYGREMP
ncbi:MAG: hypothetical protein WAZ21_03530 [Candidatus Saccharimonadales bacterium]